MAPGAQQQSQDAQRAPQGSLRSALVTAGIAMLERGETFSLRALARKVGVSQAAPYRHFSGRDAIESAMAARGFGLLRAELSARISRTDEPAADPAAGSMLVELALTYIRFAQTHPALYELMLGARTGDDAERQAACAQVFALIENAAARSYPERDAHALATAGWGLAHGLATLRLSRRLSPADDAGFDRRVRDAFAAAFVH